MARTANAQMWATHYGLPKSFTVTYKVYGQAISMILANAWASKMQFLFDVWESFHFNPAFAYPPSLVDSYNTESTNLTLVFESENDAAIRRAGQIQELEPRNPVAQNAANP